MRLSAVRWALGTAAAILFVAFGATAFACTNLATVILSSGIGHPGANIAFTGASFASPRAGSGQAPTPVVLHWQSDTGPVLAEGTPDRAGLISGYFTVPQATPGIYIIFATQLTPRIPVGGPPDAPAVLVAEAGTPARSAFEILPVGVNVSDVRPPVVQQVTEASGDLDSTVWIVLTAAFGAVALSLFGGGLIAFIHQSRQAKLPAEARWVPPGWYS